jgi:hypothetical protein
MNVRAQVMRAPLVPQARAPALQAPSPYVPATVSTSNMTDMINAIMPLMMMMMMMAMMMPMMKGFSKAY